MISSGWVILPHCFCFCLLISPVLCYLVFECFTLVALFPPHWYWCPCLVAFPSLLISPVLCYIVCECFTLVALFLPCWYCLYHDLQWVPLLGCLFFSPADISCSLLSSLWVLHFGCLVSSLLVLVPLLAWLLFSPLLISLVLCYLVCECFTLVAFLLLCWYCLLYDLQWASLLGHFFSPLLISPVLCYLGCKCFTLVVLFFSCWYCLFHNLLWVPLLGCFFLPCWYFLFSAIQLVSASPWLLCFSPASIASSMISSGWLPLLRCLSFCCWHLLFSAI